MVGSEIAGAALFAGGMAVGRVIRLRAKPRLSKPTQAVCGCEHHYSLHDPKTGLCHGGFDQYGDPVNYQSKSSIDGTPCKCKQYSGPTPLPEFYAPEIGV